MAEQNIDQILGKYNEDVKRHMGVLAEDFKDQVKIIGEQHESINQKLERHGTRLDKIEKDVGIIKTDVNFMKKDIEVIKLDIEFIKHGLKQKVSHEEFAALERRVSLLESKSN